MTPVKAYEGDQARLFTTEKEAVTSLLSGISGAATHDFQAAVWGANPGCQLSDQSKRIRAAILAAADVIKKKARA